MYKYNSVWNYQKLYMKMTIFHMYFVHQFFPLVWKALANTLTGKILLTSIRISFLLKQKKFYNNF